MLEQYTSTFHGILKKMIITNADGNVLKEEEALSIIHNKFDLIKKSNRIICLIGNGGSSGIVSHTSVDLVNTCKITAFPLTDTSQLTCFANDFGYENVFSKPLETMLSPDDALIAVSSSGSSKNILNAVHTAIQKKSFVITLSGFKSDNLLRKKGHINFWLDSERFGMVEIGHALILHYLTDRYGSKIL
jgi:D-sedoheptulose 7-phosphate isomerase